MQVRIFVEMDRIESATKAIVSLQGRFFGGKEVKATFFSEDRFARRELAPSAEELRQG
jgi:splicing factor 45